MTKNIKEEQLTAEEILAPYQRDEPLTEIELCIIDKLNNIVEFISNINIKKIGDNYYLSLKGSNNDLEAACLVIKYYVSIAFKNSDYESSNAFCSLLYRLKVLGYGHNDKQTIETVSLIALTFQLRQLFCTALSLYFYCFKRMENSFGEETPATLNSLRNLANCYSLKGDFTTAKSLYLDCFNKNENNLGIVAPDTLISLSRLADENRKEGDIKTALSLYELCLSRMRKEYDEDALCTLTCLNNQALCYMDIGDSKSALPLLDFCHKKIEKALNEKTPDKLSRMLITQNQDAFHVLNCVNNLACCHLNLGNTVEALPLFEDCRLKMEETFGKTSPSTLKNLNSLATCYLTVGNMSKALSLFVKCLKRAQSTFGESDPRTFKSASNIISCYLDMKEYKKAIESISLLIVNLNNIQVRNGDWFLLCQNCFGFLATLSAYIDITSTNFLLVETSQNLINELDLVDESKRERHLPQFIQIHASWLSIAIKQIPEHIPTILAAVQGRDMAALMLSELEEKESSFTDDDPIKQYLSVINKLRALKLKLQLVQGGQDDFDGPEGSGSRGFIGRDSFSTLSVEAEQQKEAYPKALYDEKIIVFEQLMKQKEQLKEAVAKVDADFALTRQQLTATPEKLTEKCKNNEAVVLFFDTKEINTEAQAKDGKETNDLPSQLYVCVIHQGKIKQVSPLKLNTSTENVTQYKAYHSKLYRGHQRGLRDYTQVEGATIDLSGVDVTGIESSDIPSLLCEKLDHLDEQIRNNFWQPLQKLLPEVTRWHVISHGSELHSLPLHNTVPESHDVNCYPGIVFFYQRHHHDDVAPERSIKPIGIAVHHDDAIETNRPIPFVHAETNIINAITQSEFVTSADKTQKLWQQEGALTFDSWHFSCHGQVNNQTPAQTLLVLDAKQNITLGMSQLLGSQQRPRVVVLSACVVGKVHHMEGEPIGVNAGFLLRGSDYVIAPTQPVADFYMPLFMALFYQSWIKFENPEKALIEAKGRLSSGQWYDNTKNLIREAYVPVITELLKEEVLQGDPLKVTEGWFLSQDLQQRFSRLQGKDYRGLEKDSYRKTLSKEIVEYMIDQKGNLPEHEIRHLCTWIKGFGQVRY